MHTDSYLSQGHLWVMDNSVVIVGGGGARGLNGNGKNTIKNLN